MDVPAGEARGRDLLLGLPDGLDLHDDSKDNGGLVLVEAHAALCDLLITLAVFVVLKNRYEITYAKLFSESLK